MAISEAAELEAPLVTPTGAFGGMGERREREKANKAAAPRGADAAFDVWLNRGLHQLYDSVAREPLPEELLRLIDQDREAKDKP